MTKIYTIVSLVGLMAAGVASASPDASFTFINHAEKLKDQPVVFQTTGDGENLAFVTTTETRHEITPAAGIGVKVSSVSGETADCKQGGNSWVYSGEGHVTFIADDNRGQDTLSCRVIHDAHVED